MATDTNTNTRTEKQKAKFLEALEASAGVVSTAAEISGIGRRTHYEWYNADDDYRAAVDDIRETMIDKAETTLIKAVEGGDITATIFLLKTLGKRRGYTEKVENVTEVKASVKSESATLDVATLSDKLLFLFADVMQGISTPEEAIEKLQDEATR